MGESTFLTTLSDAAFHLRRGEDRGLAGRITRAIRTELHASMQDLHVEVTHNCIMLSGQCTSFYTKQCVQESRAVFVKTGVAK